MTLIIAAPLLTIMVVKALLMVVMMVISRMLATVIVPQWIRCCCCFAKVEMLFQASCRLNSGNTRLLPTPKQPQALRHNVDATSHRKSVNPFAKCCHRNR